MAPAPPPPVDLYPVVALLGFWLGAGLLGAVATGDARLIGLGVVTLPAVVAALLAAARIRRARISS